MDPRATPRLRVDHDVPTHQRQSLTHTDEAETTTCPGCLEVEPLSSVADQKMNLAVGSRQSHFEMLDPAVFRRIVERLL